jgi:hypothetical protein
VTGVGELVVVVAVVAGVVVVVLTVVVADVAVEPVVLARAAFVELWANATSPAITAHAATNSVTAPVATRRRIRRTRSALLRLIDCACSLVMGTASTRTVGPA